MNFAIGQPVRRTEDEALLTGRGCFSDDVTLDGQVYMAVVRSPHAHAEIAKIDTAAAAALPGVLAVITDAEWRAEGLGNMPTRTQAKNSDGSPVPVPPQSVLARGRVRYVGEAVAFVVAESLSTAEAGAEAIEVDYAPMAAVVDGKAALEPGAPRVWEHLAGNLCVDFEAGDAAAVEAAFAQAARVVGLDLVNNRVNAAPLETRGAIGQYDAASGQFTLTSSSQQVHANRDQLAEKIFGIPRDQLRHLAHDVGGGFGMKNALYPEYAMVLMAARRLGRPVKWICGRSESFLSDTQGRDQVSRVELALDRDGRFLALRVDSIANIGAYLASIGPFTPTAGTLRTQGGAYRMPALHFRSRAVFTNTVPTDVYRGAGRPEACYQIERVVDAAARELGIDPVTLRRRNLIRAQDMPHRTEVGIEIDGGDFEAVLDRTLELADWDGFAARAAESRARGRRRGRGLAYYLGLTGGKRFECVDVRVEDDGGLTLALGSESAGTSHETVMPQILASHLGISAQRIVHRQADTALTPKGGGHGGSRGLEVVGTAVSIAAERVIEKARAIAGDLLEAAPADLEFADGRFTIAGTDRSVTMTEAIAASFGDSRLPEGVPGGLDVALTHELNPLSYPNGCHVAEVEVDLETGAVALVRYTVVHDLGTIIHPLTVDGQVTGATTQGIGQALLEAIVYDEHGQLLTGSLMDYALPRAADLPRFRTAYYEGAPSANNPFGLKGAGEAGCGGAPPALVNAVVDALAEFGVRHIDMPLTPERVWRAIHARTPSRAEPEPEPKPEPA
ncbi:MAG: xanthine dehydrogenase family protein molybdopterin-binding subunit [Proteobacteria bacterium]|nr:xanthine dehydrogenase family protein molybdopterin-binding subunit [Pseudomonadota bacterium]